MRLLPGRLRREPADPQSETLPAPERCLSCDAALTDSRSFERYRICHVCGFHFHLRALERVALLLDAGTFREDDRGVTALDPLSFRGEQSYRGRVIDAQRRTGLSEAALTGRGLVFGREVVVGVVDFSFLGGSIGVAAGERLARAFERAAARRVPIVTVCSTSSTRLREGLLALLQVPRVLAAVHKLEAAGVPHVCVLTDPTTGSAYTGFINRADYLVAEPNTLIGYAPLQELRDHTTADLPEGAHTAEWHLQHGLIDAVVTRPSLRDHVAQVLDLLTSDYEMRSRRRPAPEQTQHSEVVAWQQLQLSRHAQRPTTRDLIAEMTTGYVEIHGDRSGVDDPAITAGIAHIGGDSVVVIGQVRHASGHAHEGRIGPAGFRKAERAMRMAEKFRLPLLTLVDTRGPSMSLADEAGGLGSAMASCTTAMLSLATPTVAVITGEGGSEAAAAMAVADRVLMLDNAVYEVIAPEDAAKIVYGEEGRAEELAARLRITSHDCLRLGVVDSLVPEPGEGAHSNPRETAAILRRHVLQEISGLQGRRAARLVDQRLERYRNIGSTHAWVYGTAERRIAHLLDRIGGVKERLRGRRRRMEFEDDQIPV